MSLNIHKYPGNVLIMPEYASVPLNMPEHG